MVIMRPPHRRANRPPSLWALRAAASLPRPPSADAENLDPPPRKPPPRSAASPRSSPVRARGRKSKRICACASATICGCTAGDDDDETHRRAHCTNGCRAEGPAPAPAASCARPPSKSRVARVQSPRVPRNVAPQGRAREIITVLAPQGQRRCRCLPKRSKKRPFTPKPPPPPPETVRKDTAMSLPGGGTNSRVLGARVAADYDCEIMDTLTEDKCKVLRKRLRDCCRKLRKTKGGILALDAGCGAGKWLPFLGSLVDDLLAIDCSQKLVERAKSGGSPGRVTATGRPRAPCRFGVVDLTKDEPGEVERHDLVVSANVLIAPDRAVCEAILAATLKRVANGGYLVLLVPSHESARAVANVYMRHRLPQRKSSAGATDIGTCPSQHS